MFPMGPRKFVRRSAVSGDPRTYDAGTFYLCTVEEVGTDAIGKLWVSYDVELFVPQLGTSEPVATKLSYFAKATGNQSLVTTVSEPLEFDLAVVDGLRIGLETSGVFTPPAGCYLIHAECNVRDTSAESLRVDLTLLKNGATVSATFDCYSAMQVTVPASGQIRTALDGYLSMNGTDTFQVNVTATGAAGTLSVTADSVHLHVIVV
jgi:hypothetical protein